MVVYPLRWGKKSVKRRKCGWMVNRIECRQNPWAIFVQYCLNHDLYRSLWTAVKRLYFWIWFIKQTLRVLSGPPTPYQALNHFLHHCSQGCHCHFVSDTPQTSNIVTPRILSDFWHWSITEEQSDSAKDRLSLVGDYNAFFRFENGAFHECQFLDGDMMARRESGHLLKFSQWCNDGFQMIR